MRRMIDKLRTPQSSKFKEQMRIKLEKTFNRLNKLATANTLKIENLEFIKEERYPLITFTSNVEGEIQGKNEGKTYNGIRFELSLSYQDGQLAYILVAMKTKDGKDLESSDLDYEEPYNEYDYMLSFEELKEMIKLENQTTEPAQPAIRLSESMLRQIIKEEISKL